MCVGRYVLMPDHVHVFVSADGSQRLSGWIKALKGVLSRRWRTQGVVSPFWQEGFFDHVLRSGESYSEKWAYVFRNPERSGLVAQAELWPYAGEIEKLTWSLCV